MRLDQLAALLGLEVTDRREILGFSVDSRKVEPGFVFFALPGQKTDGHQYIHDAFHKGALAAVVSKQCRIENPLFLLIYVEDVLKTLQRLAKEKIKKNGCKVVGITGSMGKTTTKEFTASILSSCFKVYKSQGNANSQIGLPLSLLNHLNEDDEIAVIEMGMTGKGHILNLVNIAAPDIAVITKIAPAHLEFFSNGLEGIAEAKAEILSTQQTKCAILNAQAYAYESIAKAVGCEVREIYSMQREEALENQGYWLDKESEKIRLCSINEVGPWLEIPFYAPHLIENLLASILIARYLGMSWDAIAAAILCLETAQNRFQIFTKHGVTFVSDCYNANPESMKAAISYLPSPGLGGKKIAALGHMVELGTQSHELHAEVGRYASLHVDKLLCLGPKCQSMKIAFETSGKEAEYFDDIDCMKKSLLSQIKQGDVVLVKASNSVGLWALLENCPKE